MQGWWASIWGGPGVAPKETPPAPRHESLAALRHLVLQAKPEVDKGELAELSVSQLRDELLACNPLQADWVRQVNRVRRRTCSCISCEAPTVNFFSF